MQQIYDELSGSICTKVTRTYSTSFSIGVRMLHHTMRRPICSLYGFVRLADEIVDSFHQYDQQDLLERFESETFLAIKEGISLNPVLHAFQMTVNQFEIDHELIRTFLRSMRMDLTKKNYEDESEYQSYILGSAEVVGLMCLKIFVEGDQTRYDDLKAPAMRLGAAFQKVNFLRDLNADYEILGRTYFPGVDLRKWNKFDKEQIEKDIEIDFHLAEKGIRQLPRKARLGVWTAYIYYRKLFQKIKSCSEARILQERVRIPNYKKLFLLPIAYVRANFS